MRASKFLYIFVLILFLAGCNSNELDSLKTQNEQLQKQIDQYKTDYKALNNEVETMKSKNATLEEDLKNANTEVSVLQKSVNSSDPILELEVLGGGKNNLNYKIKEVNQRSQTITIIGYNMDGINEEFQDININGYTNGELFKVKVVGSIYDFELVKIDFNETENNFKEVKVEKQFDEVRNQNIIINTILPEGYPAEKIKWKDPEGKQYEYMMGYDGYGFDGSIIWNR